MTEFNLIISLRRGHSAELCNVTVRVNWVPVLRFCDVTLC